jgi:hypothetical protein
MRHFYALKRHSELATFLFIICLVIIFFLPIFARINNIKRQADWLQHYSYRASARKIIADYHQIPFRSPYFEGGYPMLGHPEDPSLSPVFLLTLILGEIVETKITMFLYYLVGSLGMYYLTRQVLKFTHAGALLATLVYTFGNWLPSRMMDGNLEEGYFFIFPMVLAFFLKSEKDKKYLIYTVFLLTLTIFTGKYVFPIFLLYLGAFALLKSFTVKKWKLSTNFVLPKNLVIIILLVVMLASVKIIPMVNLLSQLSLRTDDIRAHDYQYNWQGLETSLTKNKISLESNYVGILPLALCGVGFVLYFKELKRFIILLGIFIFLAMGSNAPINLYDIIRKFPIFDAMHFPLKYFNFFIVFTICLGAGKSLKLLEEWRKAKWASITGLALIFLSAGPLFIENLKVQKSMFPDEMPEIKEAKSFFQVRLKGEYLRRTDHTNPYFYVLKNVGTIGGCIHPPSLLSLWRPVVSKHIVSEDNLQISNPRYRGEVFFLDEANQTKLVHFSPNKIVVKVTVHRPDLLLINQDYDRNWRTNVGYLQSYQLKKVPEGEKVERGLLAVRIDEKGNFLVQLTYSVPIFYVGVAISAATFIFLIVLLIKERKSVAKQQ